MNRYIDEFLSKIAFHAPPSHDMMSWRTVTGSGLLCTHYIVSGLPTRSDECVMSVGCCGSLKKSPYKSNKRVYANTPTPTRCLSPTKSLAKNRFISFLFYIAIVFRKITCVNFCYCRFYWVYLIILHKCKLHDRWMFAVSYNSWIVHTRGRNVNCCEWFIQWSII